MTNSKYNAHTDPLFKSLKLLKIKDIFDVQCKKFWYKFVNIDVPTYFASMFRYNHELYEIQTRSHERLHISKTANVNYKTSTRKKKKDSSARMSNEHAMHTWIYSVWKENVCMPVLIMIYWLCTNVWNSVK